MTLIDTNVLVDIISNDPTWSQWSIKTMEAQSDKGSLLINDIVYAELAARFASEAMLESTIRSMDVILERLPRNALYRAGRAFARYRAAGGPRASVLPDFFIGAHASTAGIPILTRDARRYRAYFPDVTLIAP